MPDSDTTTIALSRKKMVRLTVFCLLFVALGLWLFTLDDAFIVQELRDRDPAFVHGVGAMAMGFFGLLLIIVARKLFDRRPGIVLSSAGLLDNSNGVSVGFIPWSDITGLEVYESFKQRMLVVKVADPGKYVETGNPLTRYLRKSTHKICGSPISINAGALKMGFDELAAHIQQYLSRYGQPA